MQLVVGILIGLAVGAVAAYVVARFLLTGRVRAAAEERERLLADAERDGEAIRREAQVAAREQAVKLRADVDQEVNDRQAEIIRIETRVAEKEEEIDRKLGEFDRREQSLSDREGALARLQVDLEQARDVQMRELERISGMTVNEARSRAARALGGARAPRDGAHGAAGRGRGSDGSRSSGRETSFRTPSNGSRRATRRRRRFPSFSFPPTT